MPKLRQLRNRYIADKDEALVWGIFSVGAFGVASVAFVLCVQPGGFSSLRLSMFRYLAVWVALLWIVTLPGGFLIGWILGILARRPLGVVLVAALSVSLIVYGLCNMHVEQHKLTWSELYAYELLVGLSGGTYDEPSGLMNSANDGPADNAFASIILGGFFLYLAGCPPSWRAPFQQRRKMRVAANVILDEIRSKGYSVHVQTEPEGKVVLTATDWNMGEPFIASDEGGNVCKAAIQLAKAIECGTAK